MAFVGWAAVLPANDVAGFVSDWWCCDDGDMAPVRESGRSSHGESMSVLALPIDDSFSHRLAGDQIDAIDRWLTLAALIAFIVGVVHGEFCLVDKFNGSSSWESRCRHIHEWEKTFMVFFFLSILFRIHFEDSFTDEHENYHKNKTHSTDSYHWARLSQVSTYNLSHWTDLVRLVPVCFRSDTERTMSMARTVCLYKSKGCTGMKSLCKRVKIDRDIHMRDE